MMGRTTPLPEDDYEVEEQKQAAVNVLNSYSQFAMVCIGEDVRPCDLRMHLMKEMSGMRSTLKKKSLPLASAASPNSTGKASSSGTIKDDMAESS
ncbi:uncharacterized protein LOC144714616 isoform X4 [Wolffia australiana]